MRRLKVVVFGVIALGTIIGILWHNKIQMQAKAKSNVAAPFPVAVTPVTKGTLLETLSLTGTIAANNDVAIVSETQGRVVAINANVGDFKRAGSVLLRVDDELKKAEYMKAEVIYERARKDADRFKSLRDEHAATDWQKENAWQGYKMAEAEYVRARKAYGDTKISTPISGVVTARLVDVGATVQSGMVVANVVDISKLKVKLNVPEQDAFKLKVGDAVEITTDVYPGEVFSGRLATIGAKGDASHSYPVEISLPNSKQYPLKAGMFGRVTINTKSAENALVISKELVLNEDAKPTVFVAENGVARERAVKLGARSRDSVQVLAGLKENELVVSFGQRKLKDGSAIQYAQ